ncbi:glycosyltransferase family 4 protein [Lipingzhangella sp. LS1_29]|uniref:Glycosyltransferase family 4 protein n=1 Tax=Lipingzhangella rawalii TaxID=2055835 RepID=A0ABU2H7K3_9ACTN|nr:glycosyltransferase family 4 protein [Lipingzhangella rawalii]MDS1271291.1 glycosyltransferase family 4 protein [Lipingzhangella rawalii]
MPVTVVPDPTPPLPRIVHTVTPGDVADATVPSGGNVFDLRLARALSTRGHQVHEHPVHGPWPHPEVKAQERLDRCLAGIPSGQTVLVDGLVAAGAPQRLRRHAERIHLAILLHLPVGDAARNGEDGDPAVLDRAERAAVHAAHTVVTVSSWAARRVVEVHGVPPSRVSVAYPGTAAAPVTRPSDPGGRLLCVASVSPIKGHDLLVDALARLRTHNWTCTMVGSLRRAPEFVAHVRRRRDDTDLGTRIHLAGPRSGPALESTYADADLLVLASRVESYAMVVTEALARGIPVLAPAVGGLPEALGQDEDGAQAGILVPPRNARALAWGLHRWLTHPQLRAGMRGAAIRRRATLQSWDHTARQLAVALSVGGAAR